MAQQQKATRLYEAEITVLRCPVCDRKVTGALTVEVHLGPVQIEARPGQKPQVRTNVKTKQRQVKFEHVCIPGWEDLDREPDDEPEVEGADDDGPSEGPGQ